MKATCKVQINFKDENVLVRVLWVKGKISFPGLLQPGQSLVQSEWNSIEDPYVIENISHTVNEGVWTPHIRLKEIFVSKGDWHSYKKDLTNIFLPGYIFHWEGCGEKPIDWLPDQLKDFV